MKKIFLIILPLLLVSCFTFDKIPEIKIRIDKTIISDIDSLEFIQQDKLTRDEPRKFKIYISKDEYNFLSHSQVGVIKLKMKNKKEVKSDLIQLGDYTNKIEIYKNGEEYKFDKVKELKVFRLFIVFIFIYIVLVISKVLVTFLMLRPKSNKSFILEYSGLNLIYYIIFIVLFALSRTFFGNYIIYIYLFFIFVDLFFVLNYHHEYHKVKSITAVLVGNIIFLTIGLCAITFIAMATR